ncbi:MAG: ATP-binding cassette domain-containing protein [Acidimicrobiales bacterium]
MLGILTPDEGTVHFLGRDISRLPVYKRARAGIGRTFQRIELFSDTTVREHLLIADRVHRGTGAFWKDLVGRGRPTAAEIERCDAVLGQLGLFDLRDEPIEKLSLGQGRLVEVGRALMTEPSLLLLDEPSSGLDREETGALAATLRSIQAEKGFAILLVEHDVDLVADFTERLYVLDFGSLIAQGRPGRPCAIPRCVTPTAARWRSAAMAESPILELRGISAGYGPFRALFGVSLTIRPGGALALLGANGAGKTTVARVASGLVSVSDGSVVVNGADLTRRPTYEFARAGIAHAPEGRSVFATFTVEENLTLSFRRSLGKGRVAAALDEAYGLFPRLGERRKQMAGTLSGGEQRMLSLARVLVEKPRLLIADELSLGLAPIVVDEVYDTLASIRASGTALLIVEQHVQHALDLCDDVVLLDHGVIAWEGPAAAAASVVVTHLFESGGAR